MIGIVVYDRDSRPDVMLADTVRRLQGRGLTVGGLLQEAKGDDASCCETLTLQDIGTGRRVDIFQNRGPGARGCRLDPAGLAHAASFLRAAIEARPDVLFVNRFGRQEAEGRGLADEIAAAVLAEIPIVVAVGEALLPAWQAYAGGEGTRLDGPAALEAWCLARSEAGAQAA
ncbi:MAG TPA: DUF2478 domain-containing protein [Beijerinckiaceae bacterium]|nr:DUF2478 domain-containing protein [Beijerinckiaceae bacterium]